MHKAIIARHCLRFADIIYISKAGFTPLYLHVGNSGL
nr:MAG TPA: hypothetical protein [Caudoviricetes sp.]